MQIFSLSGNLTFDTVLALREQGRQFLIDHADVQFDLRGVTVCDSSGLALLIDWLRFSKQRGKVISFAHMPEQLLAIAKVSGVDTLVLGTELLDLKSNNSVSDTA